jgi:hypothetical protein
MTFLINFAVNTLNASSSFASRVSVIIFKHVSAIRSMCGSNLPVLRLLTFIQNFRAVSFSVGSPSNGIDYII